MTAFTNVCAILFGLALHHFCYAEDLAESYPQSIFQARVSIIIDDLGYGLSQGQNLAKTPFPLTLAIIPFTPYGAKIADYAHLHNKEVMLHAPMETMAQAKWEHGLTTQMTENELRNTIKSMLQNIPHIKGVNNHGGSKLTQDKARMTWLMSELAVEKLYFVDSRTTANTEAQQAAINAQVLNGQRDIFLDNVKEEAYIREQLHKLVNIALRNGKAIGIGHPYPETFATLIQVLPTFNALGIELVTVSQLLKPKSKNFQHTFAMEYNTQKTE